MVNIKEYIINAAILISIIYLFGFIHKQFLMDTSRKIKEFIVIFLSIFAGWSSMMFGVHLDHDVIFDLRFVPIIIGTIFLRKPLHILIIGGGIGLSRLAFGLSEAAIVGFVNMGLLSLAAVVLIWISKHWSTTKRMVSAVLVLNVLNTLIIAFLGVIPTKEFMAMIVPAALPMNMIFSCLLV
ncbi:MAG: sensor histidine kinase [Paenibacillus sp.]|nr:sensor histidine kinase [Paenibacillus sp.]